MTDVEADDARNAIHPTAMVHPDVELGSGNVIGAYSIIEAGCSIGDHNLIGPHAVIGTPAQGRDFSTNTEDLHGVRIGSGTVLREFSSVHQGTWRTTSVGDRCYIMKGAHVPHDVVLGTDVMLSSAAHVGAHCWVGAGANVGTGVVMHQYTCVGALAMIGLQTAVVRDVPPGGLVAGVPGRLRGANIVGLRRAGHDDATIDAAERLLAGDETVPTPAVPTALEAAFIEFDEQVELLTDRSGRRRPWR